MIVVGAVVGGLLTLVLCPLVINGLARWAVLDTPVGRSSHSQPTLRGGGLAPAIGAVVGAVVASPSTPRVLLVVGATALAFGAIGLVDDLAGLPAGPRLLGQLAVAAVVVVPLASGVASGVVVVPLALVAGLWLVAYVNAFNFMDGINGISAAQVITAGVAWAIAGAWQDEPVVIAGGLVVAAAALAFLPFNFPSAKVFLGDVGSYFLGGWLAAMAVVVLGRGLTLEAAVAPLLVYVCDTGSTLARRVARRVDLMEAHREHTYQQLVAGGWSHARTTGFVTVVIAVSSSLGVVTLADRVALRMVADVALVLLMAAYLLSPRWQRHRSGVVAGHMVQQ